MNKLTGKLFILPALLIWTVGAAIALEPVLEEGPTDPNTPGNSSSSSSGSNSGSSGNAQITNSGQADTSTLPSLHPVAAEAQGSSSCDPANLPEGATTTTHFCSTGGNWVARDVESTHRMNTRARFCETLSSIELRRECFEEAAMEEFSVTSEECKANASSEEEAKNCPSLGNQYNDGAMAAANMIQGLSYVTSQLVKFNCNTVSSKFMTAAAAVNALGNGGSWLDYYLRSKKTTEEYEDYNDETLGEDAQYKAFSFLARQQEDIQRSLKIKRTTAIAASVIYTAATTAAILESIYGASPCTNMKQNNMKSKVGAAALYSPIVKLIYFAAGTLPYVIKNPSKDRMDRKRERPDNSIIEKAQEYEKSTSFWQLIEKIHLDGLLIPEAMAQAITPLPQIPINLVPEVAFEETIKKLPEIKMGEVTVNKSTRGAPLRAALSGVSAGMNIWIAAHTDKAVQVSERRGKEMRRLAELFRSNEKLCSPEEKEDREKTYCYCYEHTVSGKSSIRMDRKSDEKCVAEWSFSEPNHDPTKYGLPGTNGGHRACIAQTGNIDPNCACRRRVNSKGENSCMKVPKRLDFGNSNWSITPFVGDFGREMNSLLSGRMAPSQINPSSFNKSFARAKRIQKKALEALNKKRKQDGKKPLTLGMIKSKMLKNLARAAKRTPFRGGLIASAAPVSASAATGLSGNAKKQLEKAIQKAKESEATYAKTKKGSARSGKDDFDFSLGGSNNKGAKVVDFMKKNYDYKNNDVSEKKSESIFKILSYRYTVSGLRRLFPDEITKPE